MLYHGLSSLTSIFLYACRFLSKGGMMILATWLSQAANEEQTSVLLVILKALGYFSILIHCLPYLSTLHWILMVN